MTKVNVQIEVPEALKGSPVEEKFLFAAQELIQEQMVLRLFEQGDISSGYAAELLSITRFDFIELLGKCGISVFNYGSKEELEQEFQTVNDLRQQLDQGK